MLVLNLFICFMVSVNAGPATEGFKNQYCTDPRTMKRHTAYTEWADAYSCTRHRCQPGGRNLAIYTVGCKRVEPPESAIECEEVVEDTNMQFPYCCPRLRCLVVVRGEVWTRVLGQPWETLPAAPWSHMYKMKKPPPPDSSFLPKQGEGPVYELAMDKDEQSVLRSGKKATTEDPANCKDSVHRSNVNAAPDIVIALATNKEEKEIKKFESGRRNRFIKNPTSHFSRQDVEDEAPELRNDMDYEDLQSTTEKKSMARQITWTEIPPNQWNEHEMSMDVENVKEQEIEKKESKSPNLQALVDAIGSRMRDIENVVQRMSQKVHRNKPQLTDVGNSMNSIERRSEDIQSRKSLTQDLKEHDHEIVVSNNQYPNSESFKRFKSPSIYNRVKHMHGTTEPNSDVPLYVEDTNLNGYFSDVSNSILRRAGLPKEPLATYMAPVENRVKPQVHTIVVSSGEIEKSKKKKRTHKKKKINKTHKKHHMKEEKKKRFNRKKSSEIEKNVVSLEDSSSVTS
ncbi:PREDICTED: uncharacterized protein LOC106125006 isoform X2 [Papilio xuthus]|uniref:Uncharacterized protein LOC106125006 isoform X2 n=1 Tax=Papilio xuthus TaxID=66420 RepID=A0AAJ6ZQZ9_PAPXU|nr:PREDICTED: uncharacterized protein LOC106125006 isoform X2 [Papilio xuthus]